MAHLHKSRCKRGRTVSKATWDCRIGHSCGNFSNFNLARVRVIESSKTYRAGYGNRIASQISKLTEQRCTRVRFSQIAVGSIRKFPSGPSARSVVSGQLAVSLSAMLVMFRRAIPPASTIADKNKRADVEGSGTPAGDT